MDRSAKRAKLSAGARTTKTTVIKTTTAKTTTVKAAAAKTTAAKARTEKRPQKVEAPEESEDEESVGSAVDDDDNDDDEQSHVDDDAKAPEKAPPADQDPEQEQDEPQDAKTFKELGIVESLCEACDKLSWAAPTPIQARSIPHALAGRDIIGLAETGSGKTGAFALPVLQALLARPQPLFALVLAPTRELASQIGQAFEALGSLISLRCAVVVGGLDMVQQAIALGKKPHVVVATPGRLVDHLEKTKGFSLRTIKYLVMDEADRLLDMDFGPAIDKLLKFIPRERNTMLFSATMSNKVESLQRASLRDPVRVSISANKYQTVSTLLQNYIFKPVIQKDVHLVYLINEFAGKSIIIFTRTVYETNRIAFLLRTLGFGAIPLNGNMNQAARLGALNKFRSGNRSILVATDVAARGLDIPKVDLVVQFDLAQSSETYIHRVGRTARAGKSGRAISFVTQYDLELWLRLEAALGRKLEEYPLEKEEVMAFMTRVEEAQRHARIEMRNLQEGGKGGKGGKGRGKGKRTRDDMDAEEG